MLQPLPVNVEDGNPFTRVLLLLFDLLPFFNDKQDLTACIDTSNQIYSYSVCFTCCHNPAFKQYVAKLLILRRCQMDQANPKIHYHFIQYYIQKNKDAHLRITGHSLGGAMAQTLAYYLVKGELYQIPSEQIEVYTFASPTPFGYQAVESATFRNMNIYNFINVQDFVPNFGVTICDGIVVRLAELAGYQLSADFFDNEADGGFTQAGTNLGTNIYVNAGDQHDGFKEHSMNETYLKLVKAYIKGDIEAYEFDTDVFFSKYYDMRSHQAKNSFIDELDHIATVLKITDLFSE